MSTSFKIPGNIKQQFLPFVLNPGAKINSAATSSDELKGASPQFFTYRKERENGGGYGRLNICPSSYRTSLMKDDISHLLLYNKAGSKASITYDDIFDAIPGIQIREFLPDTKLDQCINLFNDLMDKFKEIFTQSKDNNTAANEQSKTKTDSGFAEKLLKTSWFALNYLVGTENPNLYTDVMGDLEKVKMPNYNPSDKNLKAYVLNFPYLLYYRLQSCVTTNIYEVPGMTNKSMYTSESGLAGWEGSSGFRISGLLNKIPLIGGMINGILGNVGINYMPWWDAEKGAQVKEPEIEIKFDLFNDNQDAALYNFIFVNTIVPNNKWIQYNLFQHSSCLYDIKLEGYNRLFACAGSFDVKYDGVLRDPPQQWLTSKLYPKTNNNLTSAGWRLVQNAIKERLIKIPDVYHVSMKFQSLLPANFNNFIYSYAQNNNHIDTYKETGYENSDMAEILSKGITKFGEAVVKKWNES